MRQEKSVIESYVGGELRPYQTQALGKIQGFLARDPLREPVRGLVVMATGTGKNWLIAGAANLALDQFEGRGRTLILLHRRELAHQVKEHLHRLCPRLRVGIEMADGKAPRSADVVIAGVQSIRRAERLAWFQPNLILVDEAHHTPAQTYAETIARFGRGETHVLGFTATPHRTHGLPLYGEPKSAYDSILFNYGIRDAIADGWLVDLRGFQVKSDVDISRVRIVDGDFRQGELQGAVIAEGRTALAYKAWKDVADDRQTIAFCAGVNHAKAVAEFFGRMGVKSACVTGDTPILERENIIERFRSGDIQLVGNVDVLTEGFDAPETGCILMLRPTKSWIRYTQCIGRGTRIGENSDKWDCLVIDTVDVTGKHSLCTLPGFAGLPQRTDMQGARLSRAFEIKDVVGPVEAVKFEDMILEEVTIRIREMSLTETDRHGRQYVFGHGKGSHRHQIGARRGMLTIVGRSEPDNRGLRRLYVRCDCGQSTSISSSAFGKQESCGCARARFCETKLTKTYVIDGMTLTARSVAELVGCSLAAAHMRLRTGGSLEKVLRGRCKRG